MSTFGLDYSWSRPSIASMQAMDVQFVCRYLSYDTSGKNLTRAEAQTLNNAGIWCVVVWQTTASRALSGDVAGRDDAREAAKQATAVGMPADRPIYFAVDFNATAGQQPAIHAYLDGAASVIGRDRVGMYAGYGPIARAFNAEKIAYGWQTYAWSDGQWDSRAHIQQYRNGVTVGGANVDYDRAMHNDYGQWKIGESPMAISDADVDRIARRVHTLDDVIKASDDNTTNPYHTHAWHVYDNGRRLRSIEKRLAELAKPDVDEAAIVTGVLAGLDPAVFAEAVAEHLSETQAAAILDALRARLES